MKKFIAISAAFLGLQAIAPAALAEDGKVAVAKSATVQSREQARIEQVLNKYIDIYKCMFP